MLQTSTRNAAPDDIPILALFERELARSAFPDDPIEDLEYHTDRLRKALVKQPEGMIVLVDTAGGEIIAWLWMATKKTLATGEVYGIVRSIYVRPSARRAGLGAMLAEYARAFFEERDIARVVATVHSGNLAGIRTLQKARFKTVHVTLEALRESRT